MMSSVIPARLQFQCGHAALVTLPRVKGESAAQRNDRVAREKTAALARQCDFCAPSVALLDSPLAATNGNHVDVPVTEADVSTAIAELSVVVADEPNTPSEADATPPEAPEAPVLDVVVLEPEPSEAEVPHEVVVQAIVESHAEEAEEKAAAEVPVSQPKAARKPRARRQPAPAVPATVPAKPARARRQPAPARRVTRRRAPAAATQRFVVEYQVERVVRAATIQDALRQVTALGAADVVAIVPED